MPVPMHAQVHIRIITYQVEHFGGDFLQVSECISLCLYDAVPFCLAQTDDILTGFIPFSSWPFFLDINFILNVYLITSCR